MAESKEKGSPGFTRESQSLLSKWEIPINHLEYEYLKTCTDAKEIERIVRILRSGEEGSYPDLLKSAEDKLREVKPNSKFLAVTTNVLTKDTLEDDQWYQTCGDMEKWHLQISAVDIDMQKFNPIPCNKLPPVRKVKFDDTRLVFDDVKENENPNTSSCARIKSCDYPAWEKYDPDLEEVKEQIAYEKCEQQKKKEQAQKKLRDKEREEIENRIINSLSETQAAQLASRCRLGGNEYFKEGDFLQAKSRYTDSIRFYPTTESYNNRCLTNMKLKNWREAFQDCEEVLKIEPFNLKALLRKASIYDNMGCYDDAKSSLDRLIAIEPYNHEAQNLMRKLQRKIARAAELPPATRLIITEFETGEETTIHHSNMPVERERHFNVPPKVPMKRSLTKTVLVPIASTSTFTGPCVEIVEINDPPNPEDPPKRYNMSNFQIEYNRAANEELDRKNRRLQLDDDKVKNLKPVKLDLEAGGDQSGEERRFIITPYDFTIAWHDAKSRNDLGTLANVLRRIPATHLARVIGCDLESGMLSSFLDCLRYSFTVPSDARFVESFLKELIHVDRFDMIAMFMGTEDKQAVRTLIAFLKQHDITLSDSVLQAYNVN